MADDANDRKAELQRRARDLAALRGAAAKPAQAEPETAAPEAEAPAAVPAPPPPSGDGARAGGLLELLVSLFKPKPAPPPQPTPVPVAAEGPAFTILVAALAGDADGAAAAALNQALAARPAFRVKAVPRIYQLDRLDDPAQVAGVALNTRHAVAEEDADLLVWGDFGKEGYRLRLATAANDDERAASFGLTTRIELPAELGEGPSSLLYAACLAAVEVPTEAHRNSIRRLMPAAAAGVEALAAKPPVQMSMGQQRSCQLVFGHIAAVNAMVAPPTETEMWLDKSINAYRQAQRRLARTDPSWENGLLHKHIAAVLSIKAERAADPTLLLEESIKEWRNAVECLPRALMPQEWASAQVRLGVALYRLDLKTGQTELLRESVQALQATLQVYSRTETPQRWAEVMHNIAQVLEVYGDQLKNIDVLKRSIDACHSVLEIRTRDRQPLSWAATQNTLGSALFLLDRHSSGAGHLPEAEEALAAALEVFQTHGAKGPAKVAAKNLGHVRKLAESRKPRGGVEPHWLDDPEPKK
jgi:tetratricopeptide (TPR) repeat protein